jgi:hypothetical protein
MVYYKIVFLPGTWVKANDRTWDKIWELTINDRDVLFSFSDAGKNTFFHDDKLSDEMIWLMNCAVNASKKTYLINNDKEAIHIEGDTDDQSVFFISSV